MYHIETEEADFARIMKMYAEEEGRWLLEEKDQLRDDPRAAVPLELDRKCLELIRTGKRCRKSKFPCMDSD